MAEIWGQGGQRGGGKRWKQVVKGVGWKRVAKGVGEGKGVGRKMVGKGVQKGAGKGVGIHTMPTSCVTPAP